MPQYATAAEYMAFTTGKTGIPADVDVDQLNADLRRASDRVRAAVRFARYAVDSTTGLPAAPRIREAFARATAAEMDASEVTGKGQTGLATAFDTFSAAGVTLSARAGGAAQSSNSTPRAGLSPEAARILANEGIYTTIVRGR